MPLLRKDREFQPQAVECYNNIQQCEFSQLVAFVQIGDEENSKMNAFFTLFVRCPIYNYHCNMCIIVCFGQTRAKRCGNIWRIEIFFDNFARNCTYAPMLGEADCRMHIVGCASKRKRTASQAKAARGEAFAAASALCPAEGWHCAAFSPPSCLA